MYSKGTISRRKLHQTYFDIHTYNFHVIFCQPLKSLQKLLHFKISNTFYRFYVITNHFWLTVQQNVHQRYETNTFFFHVYSYTSLNLAPIFHEKNFCGISNFSKLLHFCNEITKKLAAVHKQLLKWRTNCSHFSKNTTAVLQAEMENTYLSQIVLLESKVTQFFIFVYM